MKGDPRADLPSRHGESGHDDAGAHDASEDGGQRRHEGHAEDEGGEGSGPGAGAGEGNADEQGERGPLWRVVRATKYEQSE